MNIETGHSQERRRRRFDCRTDCSSLVLPIGIQQSPPSAKAGLLRFWQDAAGQDAAGQGGRGQLAQSRSRTGVSPPPMSRSDHSFAARMEHGRAPPGVAARAIVCRLKRIAPPGKSPIGCASIPMIEFQPDTRQAKIRRSDQVSRNLHRVTRLG